jgi:hypothetical protein
MFFAFIEMLPKSAFCLDRSAVIYLNYKYLYHFFTQILINFSIFTDDIELKIIHYKDISSIPIQLKNQRCAPDLSVCFNCIQSIWLWDAVVLVVICGQAFLISLPFADSPRDCQVKQRLVTNICALCKTANCCNTNSVLWARFASSSWQQMLCRRSQTASSPATSQNQLVVRPSRELSKEK